MTDAILVIGSGIAGLTAAEKVAAGGARAIVVEREAIIGGRLAAPMTRGGAIGARADGQEITLLERIAANERIEIITNAELVELDGRAGSFTASVRECARFVTDACTRCKQCHAVCPVVLPNEFDAGLTFRKAIYTPMIETWPTAWVIDIDNCLNVPPNYLPCNRCREVCDDQAIHFDMPPETLHQLHAGAVILAPGMAIETGDGWTELGYGVHPDIVTSGELQRLLESPGPSGGFATRPSNQEYPTSVLLVVDSPTPFGLYIASSQVRQLVEQDVERVSLLVLSAPHQPGMADELAAIAGIDVRWGTGFRVEPEDDCLTYSFEDLESRRYTRDAAEMIVLCTDVRPAPGLDRLADTAGVTLSDGGYLAVSADDAGIRSDRAGVFVAGCASGPATISHSIGAAAAAADAALALLNPVLLGEDKAATAAAAGGPGNDDLQQRIEALLLALVER